LKFLEVILPYNTYEYKLEKKIVIKGSLCFWSSKYNEILVLFPISKFDPSHYLKKCKDLVLNAKWC